MKKIARSFRPLLFDGGELGLPTGSKRQRQAVRVPPWLARCKGCRADEKQQRPSMTEGESHRHAGVYPIAPQLGQLVANCATGSLCDAGVQRSGCTAICR